LNESFQQSRKQEAVPGLCYLWSRSMGRVSLSGSTWEVHESHVIIVFSWTNDIVEDALAVDDMMHHAGVGEYSDLGRPNVAYLIQPLRRGNASDSPVACGFNVFQVNPDQETTLSERTMKYRAGRYGDQYCSGGNGTGGRRRGGVQDWNVGHS
jgi:hypothetical protein